jgi:hypothetical protein
VLLRGTRPLACSEALELKVARLTPGKGALLAEGASCSVVLLQAKAHDSTATTAAPESDSHDAAAVVVAAPPFLTVGVSNLKTSARHAARKGGHVGA